MYRAVLTCQRLLSRGRFTVPMAWSCHALGIRLHARWMRTSLVRMGLAGHEVFRQSAGKMPVVSARRRSLARRRARPALPPAEDALEFDESDDVTAEVARIADGRAGLLAGEQAAQIGPEAAARAPADAPAFPMRSHPAASHRDARKEPTILG